MDGSTPNKNDSSGWGPKGGSTGDGFSQNNSMSPPYTQQPPPQQQQQPTYNNQGFGSPPQQQPQYATSTGSAGSGSITRFASPDMQPQQQQQQPVSYAERSQQSYGNYQQPQPQGYGNQPPPSAGGYAARSQQAYGSQPQQQPYSGGAVPGGGYAARSQQAYSGQSQQQQSPAAGPAGSYAARSQQAYGAPPQQQPQYQQQPPQGGSYAPGNQPYGQPQQQPPATPQQQTQNTQQQLAASTGSYAARSAQSYGAPQAAMSPQPGITPQPQQQQTSAGSYAARSAQVLYGQPQQPTPGGQFGNNMPQQQQQYGQSQESPYGQQQPQQYGQQGQPGMQPGSMPYGQPGPGSSVAGSTVISGRPQESQQAQAMQQRILTDATRKVQEHSYYMKQAMEQQNLPVVLDRAAHMVGELGGPPHGHQHNQQQPNPNNPSSGPTNTGGSSKLTPKNYYELYMRTFEEIPAFEEYLLNLSGGNNVNAIPIDQIRIIDTANQPQVVPRAYTMRDLYDCVQYCPRVVSRLYLQIAAGSALIRSGETGAKFVMQDLQDAVKCEQNPIRGLFLRHFLLTALKDKLPDTPPVAEPGADAVASPGSEAGGDTGIRGDTYNGTVKDSYEFVLSNFMEMNKLWVRIQHLPGEGNNKDVRKRRERERNDLRILVGTNLVRLSQLECVTSKIYGEIILPQILEHIVTAGDPLSQAYLMDCLVQVFPDEYHIETLPILLNVCPRLRDKVNIRTILQGLMDRLANYLADEELLDESDTNDVKKTLAKDSFGLFEECVQAVYNARGPKLTGKEVIRLQTALLQFSIKCYPENMEQVSKCISACVEALRQANASYDYDFHVGTVADVPHDQAVVKALDEVAVVELEKLLSIPLDTLALKVLKFEHYSKLIGFLPWANRREVAMKMLNAAVETADSVPSSIPEVEELFRVIQPLIQDEHAAVTGPQYHQEPTERATNLMAGLGITQQQQQQYQPSVPFGAGQDIAFQYSPDQLQKIRQENALVSKLVHLMSDHKDLNVVYELLVVARKHISEAGGGKQRIGQTLVAIVFASLRLAKRVFDHGKNPATDGDRTNDKEPSVDPVVKQDASPSAEECNDPGGTEKAPEDISSKPQTSEEVNTTTVAQEENKEENLTTEGGQTDVGENPVVPSTGRDTSLSCRKVFVFIQETIAVLAKCNPETCVKLYLDVSLTADSFAKASELDVDAPDYAAIAFEFLTQAFTSYEERVFDAKVQYRCILSMAGTLMTSKSLSTERYESFITKTAQWSAKMAKKQDQCQLVLLCAHLFYPVGSSGSSSDMKYSNPQRALECLQRCLKLADACTTTNPAYVKLFVDTLEQYVFFFEKGNPVVTHAYISGLVALVREHLNSLSGIEAVAEAKSQFHEVIRYISKKKNEAETSQLFAAVNLG